MSISHDTKDHLASVAENTLETFEAVSTAANTGSFDQPVSPENIFVYVNTLTSPNAIGMLDNIREKHRKSLRILSVEPAIARVVAVNNKGHQRTYFICRTSPIQIPDVGVYLASYRSPVGRLASLGIGDEIQLPNGQQLEVAERALLYPVQSELGWDSLDSLLEGETYGPLTVESLRALIARAPSDLLDERLLEELLEEEILSANVLEGVRRAVLTRMALRDQPILDKFQDGIFRLPIDRCLLLLGPPGTGKTTTLIRRLGQKLDLEFLNEDEQALIRSVSRPSAIPHLTSWLMFTPTSLLQQYVKESFSREGIPASDRHVRTWTDYRREFSRNTVGMLTTSTKRSGFVLQDAVNYLADDALNDLSGWFDDFDAWQQSAFLNRLRDAAQELALADETKHAELGDALIAVLKLNDPVDIGRTLRGLRRRAEEAREIAATLKSEIDRAIHRALVLQVNRNRSFLDELAAFLDTLDDSANRLANEGDAQEEEHEDDDMEEGTPQTGRNRAVVAFRRALRTQARAVASGRALRKGTTTEKIIGWIGDRGLDIDKQMQVGTRVLLRARIRLFVNPVKSYIDGVATRYNNFRRARLSEARWYSNGPIRRTDIHPLELDMLLLSILREAKSLLALAEVRRDLEDSFWATLQPIYGSYRNQIIADEATDFSPVQLACMSALSHPATHSFFACGDFNQRLSVWGTRSLEEISWADPEFTIERVTIGYRQSRELNEFARQIVRMGGGADYDVVLPEHADREGVPPVLAESMNSDKDVGIWLADRVTEIESFVGELPSIAILVPEEDQVVPLAEALNQALARILHQ